MLAEANFEGGQATALLKVLPLKAPVVSDEESIKKSSLVEKALLRNFRLIGIAWARF